MVNPDDTLEAELQHAMRICLRDECFRVHALLDAALKVQPPIAFRPDVLTMASERDEHLAAAQRIDDEITSYRADALTRALKLIGEQAGEMRAIQATIMDMRSRWGGSILGRDADDTGAV